MSSIPYVDFDLLIQRIGNGYRAHVLTSPAGQASTDFDSPFLPLELENFLLRVGRTRRGARRTNSPELEAAKAFGARLFETAFGEEVGSALRSSLAEADRQGAGLRIRLRLTDTPELNDLPWEYLYDPARHRFLALSIETPLVRYLDLPERIRPLGVVPPLKVLVMISSPHDYPRLDVEGEWARLHEALGHLEQRGLLVLERLDEANLVALQRRLRRGSYHVFHFIGHGGFDQQAQDGQLILEDERGRGRLVSGHYLGMLLHDLRSLHLAVLNACEGARTSLTDPIAGTAQSLAQEGIPAVIAMQFEITNEAAITFAHEFYQAVADGYPIDAALAEARKAIFAQGNDIEWGTPVLYLRSPNGQIFDVTATSPPRSSQERWEQEVEVSADRRTEVALDLQPLPGTLALSSPVVGVEVWVGNDKLGETTAGGPLLRDNLPPGSYRLTARKPGYAPWEQEVEVSADQRTEVAIELMPLPGTLVLSSPVVGVEVWAGNDKLGETTAGGPLLRDNLPPGNYRLTARKPGYAPWEQEVEVSADQRTEVAIELMPLPGTLVLSSPVAEVEVWVGNDKLGETTAGGPLLRDNLPPGNYRLTARKPGYAPWERQVSVSADQRTEVALDLQPLPGGLALSSPVVGVEVWVGNDKLGETTAGGPLLRDNLPPGNYRLTARKPGYAPWERQVSVSADQRTEVAIELTLLPGTLVLSSGVEGAEVWIGPDRLGATTLSRPLLRDNLPPGSYRLTARKPGYAPWEQEVQVSADQRTEVAIELTPLPGTLVLSSPVVGVEVWAGNDKLGETTAGGPLLRDNLPPGSYQVSARKAGYQPWERQVSVSADQRTEVAIELTPLPGGLALSSPVVGVEVWVGNDKLGTTTLNRPLVRDDLPPGSYRVRARKAGYALWEREVQVSADQRAEVAIDLQPLPGALALSSRVVGVEVWVGPDRLGETARNRPLVRNNLPPGTYRIKALKPGYAPWEQEVEVSADRRSEVAIELTPLPGGLALSSRVAGAEVWVGNDRLGETTAGGTLVRDDLKPGSYRVKAHKPGYAPWERQVSVSADQRTEVMIELTPLPGGLALSSPVAGAEVWVGNDKLGETTAGGPLLRDNLPPGNYRLTALKPGYAPWEQEVEVSADQRTEVAIELMPLPGTLALSSPVVGVEVWAGNDKLGETTAGGPLLRDNLPPGNYRLTARKPGYAPWEQEVEVSADQRTEVAIELMPLPGGLALSSGVEGAEVWIGPDRLGATTLSRALLRDNLPPGSYRLTARKPGYAPWEQEVEVSADQRTEVAIELMPLPGTLVLSSPVVGVEVWVGNDKLGETTAGGPLLRDNLPPGSYRLTARKPGYAPWEQEVEVSADQRTEVAIELMPLPGTLVLSSPVVGVEVWAGNDKLGETTAGGPLLRDNLPPGNYRLTARKPGYAPWEQEVEVSADQRTEVAIELMPLPGTLVLSSPVAEVEVWVGNDKLGETTAGGPLLRDNLPPGNYRLTARKPGYAPWERQVSVSADQRTEVALDLQPLPGGLALSSPVVGVEVWVGNDKLGETTAGGPLLRDNLPPGNYRLTARKPGYAPWERQVSVSADQRTEVAIELTLLPGTLVLSSGVEGAEVWIGPDRLGATTLSRPLLRDNLPPGSYRLTARKPGYAPWEQEVQVSADQRTEVAIELTPLPGTLVLSSPVVGVEVWAGNDKLGETTAGGPLLRDNLPPGSYQVSARKAGYQPWERQVSVSADQRTEVAIELTPLPGGLALSSPVVGVEVWVGNDKLGTTTLNRPLVRDDLPPGSYRVRARKAGYALWEREVQVSADQRAEVALDLQPLPGALALSSRVVGVEVWVGPDRLGETARNRPLVRNNLPPGTYRIKALKPGYAPWEQEVEVSADRRSEVAIELTPLPGGLALSSRVAGAEVWVGNDRLGETTAGGTLVRDDLKPGSYRVKAHKPGYAPWERQVSVSADQRTEVMIELTPLPGGLALSSPVAGAEVWVGNDKLGETTAGGPLLRDNLPPGNYRLTALKPGYAPWEQEVEVSADQRTEVAIELMPLPGTLALSSPVVGVEVWAGNDKLGETTAGGPLLRDNLPPGNYRLTALKPGYAPWEQEVEVSADQRTEVAIELMPLPGTLVLSSPVVGVEVWAGNDKLGETTAGGPLLRDNLPPGNYRLKALKPGYAPWERQVSVSADQRTEVMIELTPLPGGLALSSPVVGVEVWVGNDKLGETTAGGPLLRDNLPPGSYRLTARKAGYAPWEQEVEVSADQRTEVAIELMPLPGTLALSSPVVGVEVWVGNDKLGETTAGGPLLRDNLPPGNYRLTARKPGYAPWEQEVEVSADQRTEVAIELMPLPGTLVLSSPVAEVEVWAGNDKLGETTAGGPLLRDNLPPGNYRLTALKPGYAPWERQVSVSADQRTEVAIELTLLPGTLVLSSGVEGAEVWIGPDRLGATTLSRPLTRDNLPPDSYRVRARKAGYAPWEQEVEVSADQRTEVAIELMPLPGGLALSSGVEGAEVWIGPDRLGATTLSRALLRDNLPPGSYRLTARKAGYAPWEQEVEVSADQRTEVAIELMPLPGTLVLSSPVVGVEVWVGNDKLGETTAGRALLRDNLPPGSYRLTALKPGYAPWEQEVEVSADQRTEVAIELMPLPGTLVLSSPVVGVEVWAGNDKLGETTARGPLLRDNLPPGNYRLTARKPGYAPWERQVSVSADQRTEVAIELTLLPELGGLAITGRMAGAEEDQLQGPLRALFMDAHAAMARGDWPVALEKLQAVLALEPTNPEAAAQLREVRHALDLHNLYTTAQKHYEAGRWQEALDCFWQIQERQTSYKDVNARLEAVHNAMAREKATPPPESPPKVATAGSGPARLGRSRAQWIVGALILLLVPTAMWIWKSWSPSKDKPPVAIDLLPLPGALVLSSRVVGVEVWVGTDKLGETTAGGPLLRDNLPPGSYQVSARKAGYQPWERQVSVSADQRTEVMIELTPLPGGLALSSPVAGAEVWVGNDKLGETTAGGPLLRDNLPPGSYRLKALKPGYAPWERQVQVSADKRTEVAIELTPLPGTLVLSSPVAGAEVWVGNDKLGETTAGRALSRDNLLPGSYRLKALKPGYAPWERQVSVSADQRTEVMIELTPLPGGLALSSPVAGAEVWVGNDKLGETTAGGPLLRDNLPPGSYRLKARKPGYAPWEQEVQVSADQRTEVAIELTPLPGTLVLSSPVVGVEVWVGNDKLGETTAGRPLLRDNLPPGSYQVSARKAGYQPWERQVSVSADQRTEVMIELTPLPGTLVLSSPVVGVEVWVGNDKLGTTTLNRPLVRDDLPPGSYRVRARKAGYALWEREVQVSADQRAEVAIDLQPLPGALALSSRVVGVEVWVGPDRLGETARNRPLVRNNLPPGTYRIKALKPGYAPWEQEVEVSADRRSEVAIELTPLPGGLALSSRVAGAEVWVGNDRLGETTAGGTLVRDDLKPGSYRVKAHKPGYAPWERQVQVSADKRTEVAIDLTPLPEVGGLAITGRVAGAEVWVGNDRLGETTAGGTLVRDDLKPGSYRVKAHKPGYEPWERQVQVSADKRTEVAIELTPLPEVGGLAITGRVTGAEVWVGNDKLGETTAGGTLVRDDLKPGSYRVKAHKPGYAPWERQVQVSADKRTEVAIELTPLPEVTVSRSPQPEPARSAEIRVLLDTYKRALERRDPTLYRDVRLTMSEDEFRKLKDSFEYTRSHTVDLSIDSITMSGDEAEVKASQKGVLISKDGQQNSYNQAMTFKVKRAPKGWVIVSIN